MNVLNDEPLHELQREVQRLLGRNVLRLQQYERLLKAIVAHHTISGAAHALEAVQATQTNNKSRKTLGTLVGDLLGSYVVGDEIDPAEKTTTSLPENFDEIAVHMKLVLPGTDFARAEAELKALVLLRNNLVHHFIDHHDLSSLDGCRGAQDALVAAGSCIAQHFEQLCEWANDMTNLQQALSGFLLSKAFQDILAKEFAPEGRVDWFATGIVSALREAFEALAVDDWLAIEKAGRWITERYPAQQPAKYGCRSWRQVVHEAPILELRYFEVAGQRSAFFRGKKGFAALR